MQRMPPLSGIGKGQAMDTNVHNGQNSDSPPEAARRDEKALEKEAWDKEALEKETLEKDALAHGRSGHFHDGHWHTHDGAASVGKPGHGQEETGGAVMAHTHTHTHTQTKNVINRLNRAIGHLESVRRMVEDGRDCSEVLVQLAAVRAALGSTGKLIIKDHIQHCVVDAVEYNDHAAIEELIHAIERFI